MTRVKRGKTSMKRRRNILSMVKGFRFGIAKKEKRAMETIKKGGARSFFDRKKRRGVMRRLEIVRINALSRKYDIPYNKLIKSLSDKKCSLNRRMLSDLGRNHEAVFKDVIMHSQK